MLGGIPAGVQVRDPALEPAVRSALVELPGGHYGAWSRFLHDQIGREYDTGAIWGDILGRRIHERGHWICSALQSGALRAAGLLHGLPIEESQVTPDSLYLIVTAGLGGRVVKRSGF